jgi:polysaccharide chain length determinant protein (PEP-CTERM system associated)
MLPGKKYTPEEYLWIIWKRKWFIVIPTVVATIGTFLYAQSLPNRYRTQTTVLVIPQRVPENFVQSTVTADISERLTIITQQILSRTRLERLIEEFNLYPEERKTKTMEDVVELMRKDVNINSASARRRNQDASSFTVSYSGAQPRTVMLVTERIAQAFVNENMEDRGALADTTSQFLLSQLEDARRRLAEHEQKQEEFRRRNAGRLPSQLSANLQMMQSTQQQIQANAEAANRERDRLLALEKSIEETASIPPPAAKPAPAADVSTGTAAQQLENARASLRNLELRWTPDHPDIVRTKRVIADLEQKAEAEALATRVDSSTDAVSGLPRTVADKLIGMRRDADLLRASLENRKREDERLRAQHVAYASRIATTPELESELTALMRDYDTVRQQYDVLLRRSEESKIAANLERRQIGEQFRVIDGARLPERPYSPDRVRMNMLGAAGGFGLGFAIVALLAYRDTTLKTDEDVIISLALPVLAVIPTMVTGAERRRSKRRRLVVGLSMSFAALLVVAAIVAWQMQLLEAWVR